jgi:predicted lipoprotein with Yx(FWY)xxD motif
MRVISFRLSALLLSSGVLVLAGCGGAKTTQAAAAAPTGPVLTMTSSKFGTILTDSQGMALYTATGDTATASGCTGRCLKAWPPLLTPVGSSQPAAGPGVTGLGTFSRSEGVQVTYDGMPLYTWYKDRSPGQVTGDGVVDSGGTWHVATVKGSGNGASSPVTTAPPATSTPTTVSGGGGFSY